MYGINIRLVRLALLLAGLALLVAPGAALAAPSVTVAPASGPPGTTFVINGTGFNAGETITYRVKDPTGATTSETMPLASGQTSFRLTLNSDNAPPGAYTVDFVLADGSSAGTVTFTVIAQGGGGAPSALPAAGKGGMASRDGLPGSLVIGLALVAAAAFAAGTIRRHAA